MRRVYPGFVQLAAFMSMNLERHLRRPARPVRDIAEGNDERAATTQAFYDEYFAVLDLAAEFYLETVAAIFQEHDLAPRRADVARPPVDPPRSGARALLTVEGEHDDICSVGPDGGGARPLHRGPRPPRGASTCRPASGTSACSAAGAGSARSTVLEAFITRRLTAASLRRSRRADTATAPAVAIDSGPRRLPRADPVEPPSGAIGCLSTVPSRPPMRRLLAAGSPALAIAFAACGGDEPYKAGLIIKQDTNPFFEQIRETAERLAAREGLSLNVLVGQQRRRQPQPGARHRQHGPLGGEGDPHHAGRRAGRRAERSSRPARRA